MILLIFEDKQPNQYYKHPRVLKPIRIELNTVHAHIQDELEENPGLPEQPNFPEPDNSDSDTGSDSGVTVNKGHEGPNNGHKHVAKAAELEDGKGASNKGKVLLDTG